MTETMDWEHARADAGPIRFAVFVDEQKVPVEMELDAQDAVSIHAIARVGAIAVGTGRLLPAENHGDDRESHIGRMAVLKAYRARDVGAAILAALIEAARARGDTQVALSAQIHALGFYRRFGFVEEGETYMDAGIEHRLMRRRL
ncbi:MAG: GNAT family N-acetyltransferase [Betaproteobacteria bacterium]|nr:GNAT family N-acetyltransferase [Betaproteobacteria bacterium]